MNTQRLAFVIRLPPGATPPVGVAELRDHGFEVRVGGLTPSDPVGSDPDEIVLLRGNPNWHRPLLRRLAQARQNGSAPVAVLWHIEPLPLPDAAPFPRPRLRVRELVDIARRHHGLTDPYSNAWTLRRIARERLFDAIAVTTPSAQAYLAERGMEAAHVPLGWWPEYGCNLGLQRDIDVVFLGEPVRRRRRMIARLRAAGVDVQELGGWSWSRCGVWGEERTRLLNRTRILLNLTRHPGLLSGLRMLLGMGNGALLACEPIFDASPYREGEHFVSAPLDQLPGVIVHHLEHEDERAAIAERARRFVTQELTGEVSIARMVELIERASAGRGSGSSR